MNRLPKVLITGASGFTGQHACRYFLKAGYEVIAVTRSDFNKPPGTLVVKCDLTKREAVRNLIKQARPQFILHLAGQNHVGRSWNDPISTLEANVNSTLHLIEAIRLEKPDCKTVIVGSALQFDPSNPSTLTHPYSFSKTLQILAAHAWEKLYNLHIVIAKPNNLIGPGHSNGVCSIFANKIVEMERNRGEAILEVNNLGAQRDFIDVRDAVSAYEILLAKGKSGETYNISSGHSYSLEDIITIFQSLTTVNFTIKSNENNNEEKVDTPPYKALNLGWKPTIPIQSSLEDILNFYRQNN